jgi:hypothetical protein
MDDDFLAAFDADIEHAAAVAADEGDATGEPAAVTDTPATAVQTASDGNDEQSNDSAKRVKLDDGSPAKSLVQNATTAVPSESSTTQQPASRKRSRGAAAAGAAVESSSWAAPTVNPEYIRAKLSMAGEVVPSIGPALPPHLMKQQQPTSTTGPRVQAPAKPESTNSTKTVPSYKTPSARSLSYMRGLTPGQAAIVESQQSAYAYDPTLAGRSASTAAAAESTVQAAAAAAAAEAAEAASGAAASAEANKTATVRYAGGKVWQDETLNEWPENDYRIFVGNLGIEVTDELLLSIFKDYPSATKAKVVKEKKTRKVKGFGFVSFMDPFEMVRAIKQMNGKYCGSRPMQVRKSEWQKRTLSNAKEEKKKWRRKHGL